MARSTDPGGGRWLPAAVMGLLVVTLVTLYTVDQVRQERLAGASEARQQATEEALAPPTLGPARGTDVPTYLERRRQALAAADGERVAVVSLAAYLPEAGARALVGGARVLDLLVALPGEPPATAGGGVARWLQARRAPLQAELEELRRLIPTVGDAAFRAVYEEEAARLAAVLGGLGPDAAVVYGLVVRAPAATLQGLAGDERVRLVDVGGTEVPGRAAGLRPEETALAGEPPVRPAPAPVR